MRIYIHYRINIHIWSGSMSGVNNNETVVEALNTKSNKLTSLLAMGGATGPLIGLILLCIFLTFATDFFFHAKFFKCS